MPDHPTTLSLLIILHALADDGALAAYGIDLDDPDDAPLDKALSAWRAAGYPGTVAGPDDERDRLRADLEATRRRVRAMCEAAAVAEDPETVDALVRDLHDWLDSTEGGADVC